MLGPIYATQPREKVRYSDLFRKAFSQANFQKMDIAVAYATLKGITSVQDAISAGGESAWRELDKRWVVGIDWCRSEPLALEYIANLANSDLKIFDGISVVNRQGCVPSTPFHPKVFILHADDFTAVICGSANLSLAGQTRGHEVGSLVMFDNSVTKERASLTEVTSWFEFIWNLSSAPHYVLQSYRKRYETTENMQAPVPTEDDASDLSPSNRTTLSGKQLRQLRACRHLWVEAGNLHANRGFGKPGNQLMLSRLTRVFFGLPATEVPRDTLIGRVRIEFQGNERSNCALRYSNNAMDVLGLPIPGTEGPPSYDHKTVLFEKVVDQSGPKYLLHVGSAGERETWSQSSDQISGHFRMKSSRQWGVF